MKTIKIIGLIFLMTLSANVFAQNDTDKSEIVMTEAELESFLNSVAEARRAQIKADKEANSKNELAELRMKYNNQNYNGRNSNVSDYEILKELARLNARVELLTGYRDGGSNYYPGNGSGSNSTIVVPGGAAGTTYLPGGQTQLVPTNQANNNNDRQIWELQQQLDSLKRLNTSNNLAPENQDIADLKAQFQTLESQLANSSDPAERRSLLEDLLAKFKNFKKQVFFANNSDQLSSFDYSYVQEVTQVLKDYPELSVVLEGWASPKGNADYNKQLSMRRAESVERAILDNGISPERIVSSFRGEDNSTTEAMARRVDMSIILK